MYMKRVDKSIGYEYTINAYYGGYMIKHIVDILESIKELEDQKSNIPPTQLYNEGWMLRLVLKWFNANTEINHELSMKKQTRWYSEALLSSRFLPKSQKDKLSEKHTHADGVYGDFDIVGKGDLLLKENCRQFVVVEAKMFSKYSKGTKNAPNFNQAARNVACMCNIVTNSGQKNIDDISFFTIVPEEQISQEKTFTEYINIEHIKKTVLMRINKYNDRSDYQKYLEWYNSFLCFCKKIKIKLFSWEEIIKYIISNDPDYGNDLNTFYEYCIKYNKK